MENNNSNNKQGKLRNKILKIIPKAVAAVSVTFQSPPFSPGRDHKLRSSDHNPSKWYKPHGNRGFSGPIIPNEARTKSKGIDSNPEPTSPKVSCMGQIKKKQIQKANKTKTKTNTKTKTTLADSEQKQKAVSNKIQRMFSQPKKRSESDSVSSVVNKDAAPPLGQMRRFASGRETFSNFDWTSQIAPEELEHRGCYTDDDRAGSGAEEEDEDEEEERVIIPFSAPILPAGNGGGRNVLNLTPRKEINLWKRRTMAPPRPLQLKPLLTAK